MQNEEIEIDILDLCKKSLRHWKAIIFIVFLCTVGWIAANYVKQQMASQTLVSEEQTVSGDLENALTDSELADVNSVKATYLSLQSEKAWLSDSILASLDCNQAPTVTLGIYVSGTEATEDIRNAYMAYVNGGSWVADQTFYPEVADAYLAELVSATTTVDSSNLSLRMMQDEEVVENVSTEGFFVIKVYGEDLEQADALAQFLWAGIEAYESTVSETMGTHKVELVSEDEAIVVDETLRAIMIAKTEAITELTERLSDQEDDLTDAESSVWEVIEAQYEQTDTIGVAGTTDMEAEVLQPTISKKTIAVGVLVGVFAAICYVGCIYIFCGKVHTGEELSAVLDMPLMFVFSEKRAEESREKEILVDRIEALRKKEDCKKILMISSKRLDEKERDVLAVIKKNLERNGDVAVTIVDLFLENAGAAQEIAAGAGVIVIETLEGSKRANLVTERTLLHALEARCLGAISFVG